MINPRFEKKAFKKEVEQNVKQLFRKTVDEVSQQELYQAVSYVVKDAIIDDWIATQKQCEKDDPKIVYYMSMEFLLGRALGNNLINMTAYKEVKEALEEMGLNRHLERWMEQMWRLLKKLVQRMHLSSDSALTRSSITRTMAATIRWISTIVMPISDAL